MNGLLNPDDYEKGKPLSSFKAEPYIALYTHTAATSLGLSLKLLVFIESKERPKVDQKTVFLDGSQPSEAWRRLGIVLSQRAVWGTQCVYN